VNVLLGGAGGFIGSALRARLDDLGHRTVRLVRPGSRGGGEAGAGELGWDPGAGLLDAEALARAGPFDAVVHLGGVGVADRRWTAARRAQILDSRVRSTALLSTRLARLATPPGVLVAGSAIGVYGDRGHRELTEDDPPGTGFLPQVVQAWEAATGPARDVGIRVVTLRSGLVLDAAGGLLRRLLPAFRLGLGARLGDGTQDMSWITLEDELRAIVALIGDGRVLGPVNVTAPNPATNAELTEALARAVGRPARLVLPAPVLELALGRQMAREVLLASQRVLPGRLESSGFAFAHPELPAALAALVGR
jgi:uncharacterized protein (TIGR01777 family)